MRITKKSAQQIVEEIGKLVRQNINLMDETGHIIASNDPARIGKFHEGAYRIISQHLPEFYITPELENELPDVRRGINLPIVVDGQLQGVIGITGDYDAVIEYGQIVKKMAEILIRERSELDNRQLDLRVRSRFLEDWILGTGLNNPRTLPERWTINYRNLTFNIKPMGFKHTGLFPEQAVNWDWFSELIKKADRPIRVLNLFAYTGGATVAALEAGAEVVHVDASKGMVTWAKENVVSSGLGDRPVRYIVDDVVKFVQRENRRGRQYDAIIMDPPSYGRGPSGEVWKIENELYPLIEECMKILSDKPLFFLINSYTTGLSAQVLINVLSMTVGRKYGGKITADEIGLTMKSNNLVLPCGISGRWQEHSTK